MHPAPMPVQRADHDGIPVFWADVAGPFRAALVFRVGMADETLATRGITHLVEHLALYASSRRLREANGFVDLAHCVFHAEGEQEEVLEWMARCVEALAGLPFDRLPLERQVLRSEAEGRGAAGVESRLLDHRFGAQGFGLVNYFELGLRWLGPEEVGAWAAERFTRPAAAVWMSARPPDGFTLDLADGAPAPPLPCDPLDWPFLLHIAEGTGGLALGAVGPRSSALQAAFAIATDRLYERLRLELGLVYDPWGGYEHLGPDLAHTTLGASCPDDRAADVRDELHRVVVELSEHGPRAEELADYRRRLAQLIDQPQAALGELDMTATRHLNGMPPLTAREHLAEVDALGTEEVAAAFRDAIATAILLTPEGVEGWPGLTAPEWPQHDPVTGTSFRGEAVELRVAADGLTVVDGAGHTTLRWDELVAAERGPARRWVLTARDNRWVLLPFDRFDYGELAERAVRERLPGGIEIPSGPAEAYAAVCEQVAELPGAWRVADELAALTRLLRDGEAPQVLVVCPTDDGHGLLALTSARVLWLHEAEAGGGDAWELADVKGAEVQRRLLRGARLELGVEPPRVFELGDWADQGERFMEAVGARA